MHENAIITEGSGNVFADLGLPNAEERKTKADLAYRINTVIAKRRLTQRQVGEIFELEEPPVYALMRGRLNGFSVEQLTTFLARVRQSGE